VSDAPRRRRSEEDSGSGGGGGLPLFPLILVVIFAGLLLGGVLAKFFGGASSPKSTPPPPTYAISPDSSMAPLAMATRKPPAPIPTPALSANAKPATKPAVKLSSAPTASPSAEPTAAPPLRETPKPVASPSAHVVYVTPAPLRATDAPNSVFTPSAAAPQMAAATTAAPNFVSAGPDQAATIVRSYLGALARGDRATATSYLAHGLPSEGFMDANSRILSVHPESSVSPYKVSADVQTSTGEYFITFTLQQGTGGLQIVDHYAIKPQ
jgi:hypothetical protein